MWCGGFNKLLVILQWAYIQFFSVKQLSIDFIYKKVIVAYFFLVSFWLGGGISCALASNLFDIFTKMTLSLFVCLSIWICRITAVWNAVSVFPSTEKERILKPFSAKKLYNKALRVTQRKKQNPLVLFPEFWNKVKNNLLLRIELKPHNLSIRWPYAQKDHISIWLLGWPSCFFSSEHG